MSGQIPQPGTNYSQAEMAFALAVIEQRLADLERIIADGYIVQNATTLRTLDVATATLPDLASFVATLISDFKQKGMLG